MNVIMDWGSLNINVPRAEMTLIQSTPVEIRELDIDDFRYAMHDQQDCPCGMAFIHMHEHIAPFTVSGVTLARVVEIVNDYTITFEDGDYNVVIVGGNSNILDRTIRNNVGVTSTNSAGLVDNTNGTTPEEVWAFADRTLTQDTGLNEEELHTALDTYEHKEDWMADVSHLRSYVWVDTELLVDGDGTQKYPFNNITSAKDFCELTGIRNMLLSGEILVPGNMKGVNIHGIGLPRINFNGMDIKNSKFYNCSLSGTYLDNIIAEECVLENAMMLKGHFNKCKAMGSLLIGDAASVLLVDCISGIPGLGRPTINKSTSNPVEIGVRGWRGGLTVYGFDNAADTITVEIDPGSLTFANTCTAGVMVARGVGIFVNEAAGSTVINEVVNDDVNITRVKGTEVTDIEDFKVDPDAVAQAVLYKVV